MRKEATKKIKIEDYYHKQEAIKTYVKANIAKNQSEIAKGLKIDPLLVKYLKLGNVLIDVEGRLKWSLKIPNSYILAETMMNKCNGYYQAHRASKVVIRKRSLIERFFNLLGYQKM